MRIFVTDLVILCLVVWLFANLIKYLFFKDAGGGFFSLSNYWIKREEEEKNKKKEKGFVLTLTEIMIVVAIVAILFAIAIPNIMSIQQKTLSQPENRDTRDW